MESVAILHRRIGGNFRVVLVGGNFASIADYQKKAQGLGIAEQICFAGFRPEEQIGTFFSLADILVSPRTLGGNTPLKLYSYMATGKPIVATRISSHTQVLSDSSAFLAEPSAEKFSQALQQALDSTAEAADLRRKRAAECLELIRTKYNAQEFHRRMAELYQFSLGQGVSSRPSNNSVPLKAALL